MPPDAAERVRAFFERFNITQEPQFDDLHPDVEWHLRSDLPDSRTLRGHEDVGRLHADWTNAFEDLHLEPIEITEEAGTTLVRVHFHAGIKGSDQELDMDEVWLLSWCDERVIEIREFNTKEDALRSLGQATVAAPNEGGPA